MSFREFLIEGKVIKMSSIEDIPSYLKSSEGKVVAVKSTHQYVQLNGFKTPVYVQVYFADKNGKSLADAMSVNMDDVNSKKLFFGTAYYTKGRKNVTINSEKDLPK